MAMMMRKETMKGDDEVDEPFLFHARRLPFCIEDKRKVTYEQHRLRIEITKCFQGPPAVEGGKKDRGGPCTEQSRDADIALPDQGLLPEKVAAEADHKRRNGKEAQPLDQEPGAVMEELIEKLAPLVEGNGQAEGREGEMERLPFLGNHQCNGHCDAYRHQHENFHDDAIP